MEYFAGFLPVETDIYKGVHVTLEASEKNEAEFKSLTVDQFDLALQDSLASWVAQGNRCVWFRVPILQTHFIPVLAKNGFNFHYAKTDFAVLLKWIKVDEENKAPGYAHSMVGVGGLVYNPKSKKVLLVQENTSVVKIWKFPGGYSEPGEDLFETAIREVKEETGLSTVFHSLLTFRHRKNGTFGCSDFYYVCLLQPADLEVEGDGEGGSEQQLKKCDLEIAELRWFDLEEAYSLLGGFNKFVLERFLSQYEGLPLQLLSKDETACKGSTVNSEMINSHYGHLNFNERVYAVGPIHQFKE